MLALRETLRYRVCISSEKPPSDERPQIGRCTSISRRVYVRCLTRDGRRFGEQCPGQASIGEWNHCRSGENHPALGGGAKDTAGFCTVVVARTTGRTKNGPSDLRFKWTVVILSRGEQEWGPRVRWDCEDRQICEEINGEECPR